MKREIEFEKSLVKTIDVQLKQVFGEMGTLVIYDYLQSVLSLRQEEIPKKLEVFAEGLDRFLSSGARVVEKVILDGLYSDFSQDFQFKEGYTFVDYVNALRTTVKKDDK
ncbi:MAG: hypothetical protein OEY24_06900 [Candidatus Bathyarchaeota archaeon]|nr:hypothetical protein [Candidatus Bathyarchaeota archaeon]MDH5495410.1 hypothetical protein [Candidatus Bathyarchaeota archaeon]